MLLKLIRTRLELIVVVG